MNKSEEVILPRVSSGAATAAAASLRGWSMVSIFCMGMAQPATSTSRRLPHSSFPAHPDRRNR